MFNENRPNLLWGASSGWIPGTFSHISTGWQNGFVQQATMAAWEKHKTNWEYPLLVAKNYLRSKWKNTRGPTFLSKIGYFFHKSSPKFFIPSSGKLVKKVSPGWHVTFADTSAPQELPLLCLYTNASRHLVSADGRLQWKGLQYYLSPLAAYCSRVTWTAIDMNREFAMINERSPGFCQTDCTCFFVVCLWFV